MEKKIDLSIIVPIYMVEKYLNRSLNALVKQKTKYTYEAILVDDGSKDNSAKIIKSYVNKYPDIFKSIYQENFGVSVARNNGINIAKGTYLAFVDPDDLPLENYVETLVSTISENDSDIAIASYYKRDENGEISSLPAIRKRTISGLKASNYLLKDTLIRGYPWNKIVKRELVEKYKIRFIPGALFEDIAFFYKCFLCAKKVTLTSKKVYIYSFNRQNSLLHNTFNYGMLEARMSIFFALRAYADQILGKKKGAKMFKNTKSMLLTLWCFIPPVATYSPFNLEKLKEASKILNYFRYLSIVNLPVYNAPWAETVLLAVGPQDYFTIYKPDYFKSKKDKNKKDNNLTSI